MGDQELRDKFFELSSRNANMLHKSDDEDFTSEIFSSKSNLRPGRLRFSKLRVRRQGAFRSSIQVSPLDCYTKNAWVVVPRTAEMINAKVDSSVSSVRSIPRSEEEIDHDESTCDQALIEKCGYEMKSFRILLTQYSKIMEQNNNNVNEKINYSSTTDNNKVGQTQTRRSLWSSTNTDTSKGSFFICAECEGIFCHKESLIVHLAEHTRLKHSVCTNCKRAFYRECTLQEHQKVCCPDKSLFSCRKCKKRFTRMLCLRRHVRLVHPKILICYYCKNSFPCKSYIRDHIQMKHMSTSVSSNPTSQRTSRRSIEKGYFPCSSCSKSFDNKMSLSIHTRRVHVKRFECSTCERTFDEEDEWTSHVTNAKESFCCAHCERLFCEKKRLKRHILIAHMRRRLCYATRSSGLTAEEIGIYRGTGNRITRSTTRFSEKLDLKYENQKNTYGMYLETEDD